MDWAECLRKLISLGTIRAIKNRLGGMIGQMNGFFSKIEGPAENGSQTLKTNHI